MPTIKKGADPKGTKHNLIVYGREGQSQCNYVVREVSGIANGVPSDTATIHLAFCGGRAQAMFGPQTYVSMPLKMFVEEAAPMTEADIFWENKKGENLTEE